MPASSSFTKRRSFSLGRDDLPLNGTSPWALLPKPGVHARDAAELHVSRNTGRVAERPAVAH